MILVQVELELSACTAISHARLARHPHRHDILTVDPPLIIVAMSKTTPTASSSSSSSLQAIFEASLKVYEKKTKRNLLTHPLMVQLQACTSPADTLAVLRSRAAKFEQTMDADDKLIKWLDPIVNVLSASSSVISAGVGLVNPIQMTLLLFNV